MAQLSRETDDLARAEPSRAGSVQQAAALSIVIGIMLAMFPSALEQTIVAPALPTIGRAFGDVGDLSWVVTAYLLSATAATPLFGKLSDIHGRRAMMTISLGVFSVRLLARWRPAWARSSLPALQGFGGGACRGE
jgi:MFS family permease